MRLRSLTDKQLKEEILWTGIDAEARRLEKRYYNQSNEEQIKEYHDLHAIYQKYWDEAVRRKLVENPKE